MNKKGFTLAEIMITFAIISFITLLTIGISKAKIANAEKALYYSSISNVKEVVGNLIADGVIEPDNTITKALPDKAHTKDTKGNWVGFCDKFADMINTAGDANCSIASTITDATTDFSSKAADINFTLKNGMVFYNFGADPGNVSNPDLSTQIYTIYIDIDGLRRGKSKLNEDVIKLSIDRNGYVYPPSTSVLANDATILSTSVSYYQGSTQKWLAKEVSFREAACTAGVDPLNGYCNAVMIYGKTYPQYTKNVNCTSTTNCSVVINKPMFAK